MPEECALTSIHPGGEVAEQASTTSAPTALDTFAGKVFVRWDPDANVTGFGPAAYFIEFLKTNGLWERWVADCPLHYTSPNAPPKQDILGTVMLSVLAGHKRYAHISTVRSDSVLPELLGMKRVRSEDAVRRAFQHGEEEPWTTWTRQHLAATYDGTEQRLYVNGAQVATRAQTGTIVNTGNPLRIGGNGIWGEYFQGLIDEVRVYRRALSPAREKRVPGGDL